MTEEAVKELAAAIEHLATAIDRIMSASAAGVGGLHVHHHGIPTTYYQGGHPGSGGGR